MPGPLIALIVGTLLGVLALRGVPVIGPLPSGLPQLHFGLPSAAFLVSAIQPALILALLGSVDSLLTSLVADSLTGTRHNADRELIGQGIGNMVAGFDRRRSRRRGHHGNGDQHPRRRKDAGVGCVARGVRAGAAVGSRTLRRADSACRAGRDPDEGGLGHHRLADAHAYPPHPARAPDRDADHARPDGVRGPGDGGGDRAYRGGHGARASVGAAGARRRHVGADARPGVSRRHLARRVRSLLGAGGAGGVARQFHRGFLTQAGGGDQRRHQGS